MTGIVAVPGIVSPRDASLIKAIVEGIMPEIGALVREATTPLLARIDALEKRELLLPEKGDPGDPGPPGEPGPAAEVDMVAVRALIDEAVAALPPAEKGDPGDPGLDVDMAEVATRIEHAVKSAVAALPAPKDGEQGKDGAGLANALKDAEGNLVLVLTDGRTKSLGKIDGKPGKDGVDGITPEFMDAEFVGRTLRLTFGDGERAKTVEFQMATPEYRGVFKESEVYEPGDMVTWAGSCWHCDEAKGLKPGAPDSGWTLAVKAGRAGKDVGK